MNVQSNRNLSNLATHRGSIRSTAAGDATRHRPSFTLLITTLLIICIGLVMLYSASSIYGLIGYTKPNYYFIRQIGSMAIGLVGMIFFMNVYYRRWYRIAPVFFIGSFVLLLIPLISGLISRSSISHGAARWIRIGSLSLQPSEIAIVSVIFYLSFLFARSWNTPRMKEEFARALFVTGFGFLLIFLEPDMGTAMMLLVPCMSIVIAAGMPRKSMFRLFLLSLPLLGIAAASASYRLGRIKAYLDPSSDTSGVGYQMQNSYYAIADGGWFGKGLGHSIQKFLYLPEGHTDFIFAIVIEEMGILRACLIIMLFGLLVYKGFDIALRVKDPMGKLLAIGITTMIGFAVFINIATVTGLVPATGIPLPFISYGGTSLVFKMWSIGILLNISRYTEVRA